MQNSPPPPLLQLFPARLEGLLQKILVGRGEGGEFFQVRDPGILPSTMQRTTELGGGGWGEGRKKILEVKIHMKKPKHRAL